MRLRAPSWLFAVLGVLLFFAVGLASSTWLVGGFGRFDPDIAFGLAWPVAIGAGLAAGLIGGRLRRGLVLNHADAVLRAVMAGSAAGFTWPLSNGLTLLLQGDARNFFGSLPIAIIGALIGAAAGALSGAAASYVCLRR